MNHRYPIADGQDPSLPLTAMVTNSFKTWIP